MFRATNSEFDVVAFAGSAGAVELLLKILPELPRNFPAAILVAQHLSRDGQSRLATILARDTKLPVKWAMNGDKLQGGQVFISPPNRLMQLSQYGTIELTLSDPATSGWAAPDVMFASLARTYGNRSIGIVLCGFGYHGALGAEAIQKSEGMVLSVGGPDQAHFGMPHAAVERRAVDLVLPSNQIGFALVTLTMGLDAGLLLPMTKCA